MNETDDPKPEENEDIRYQADPITIDEDWQ
jgi:hypothetical protein